MAHIISEAEPATGSIGDWWQKKSTGETKYWNGSYWALFDDPVIPKVLAVSVTSPADTGNVTVATVGTNPVVVDSIVLHADTAQTANMTSCGIFGGVGKVVTFISAADAIQANLNAADKQIGWTGAARLAVGKTIVVTLVGTGGAAVDLTVTITYHPEVAGGVLT